MDKLIYSIQNKFKKEIERNNNNNIFLNLNTDEKFEDYLYRLSNDIIRLFGFIIRI